MFKILSRKKYNKLKEDNDKLNKELDSKISYLNCMLERVTELNKEIENLKLELKREGANNIDLQKQISTLINTNQKLNNWIDKILNEVGIQELHERTGVTIPVYTENPVRAYDGNQFNNGDFLRRKEIIIPELRFIKMG